MDTTEHERRRKVRRHASALRAQVLAECAQPGASVAQVALSHGLNANLVHKWRREERPGDGGAAAVQVAGDGFMALPLAATAPVASAGGAEIRLELRRGATTVNISWPVAASAECAAWLARWLR
ncbi:MAG: transposase [Ramlibacter sp.]